MATAKHTEPAEAHRLALHQYPPDQKVGIIKIVKECTGLDLHEDVAEELPAVLSFESAEEREAAVNALRAAGAVVTAEPTVTDPAAFLTGVERQKEFRETPQGQALTDCEEALYSGIALLGTAISSLENETAERDDVEREVETLRVALERLEAARSSLDKATTAAVRS